MKVQLASLLIVDDDPVFSTLVRQMVLSLAEEFPCVPVCVDTAEKAIEELNRTAYDLTLLDYHLPGTDGLQILAQIHDLPADRQPSVIMLTGSGSESVAVESMKRGARDYLVKAGLDRAPLLRALRSALSQKRLADQVSRYNAQMRTDLEMARHLQESLLPDDYPRFPRSASPAESALRFCHRFYPAAELAGDFFSVLPLSDLQAGVLICDVMGHGVRAALVTAMLRALVDNANESAADPGRFLSNMNQKLGGLLRPSDGPMFATAFYMIVDAARGRLLYASAGHPPALHLQPQLGVANPLPLPRQHGPALGLFPDAAYPVSQCPIQPGDVFLLFTDGAFELTDADGDQEYGKERLLATARKNMRLAPNELCDAIISDIKAFTGGGDLEDDVCLLSVAVQSLRTPSERPIEKVRMSEP